MSQMNVLKSCPSFKHITSPDVLETTLSQYVEEAASHLSDPEWHISINKEFYHILFIGQELFNDNVFVYNQILCLMLRVLETQWSFIIKTHQLLSSTAFLLECIQRLHRHPLVVNKKLKMLPLKASLQPLFKMVLKDFSTLIHDKYASIIVRHSLKLMAGILTSSQDQPSDVPKQNIIQASDIVTTWPLDDDIAKHLIKFCNSYLLSDITRGLLENETASPCLQLVLVAASVRLSGDEFEKVCKRLLKKKRDLWSIRGDAVTCNGNTKSLPTSMQHPVCSYFVEQFICVMPEQQLNKFIKRFIFDHELHLCQDKQAGYILQRVISCIPPTNISNLTRLLNATLPHFKQFPLQSVHKVLQAFAKAALSCKAIQTHVLAHLKDLFNCDNTPNESQLFPAILYFQPYQLDVSDWGDSPNFVGTLLLQTLLQFKKPQVLVDSFMKFATLEKLQLLCCHSFASRVIDAIFKYKCMKLEDKIILVRRLLPISSKLACDKFGSRIMDSLWDMKILSVREMLTEALAKDLNSLKNHQYGGFVFKKFALGHYLRSRQNWLQWYGSHECDTSHQVSDKSSLKKSKKRPADQNINKNVPEKLKKKLSS